MRKELIDNQRAHELQYAYKRALITAASNVVRRDEDTEGWYPTSSVHTMVGGEVYKEQVESDAMHLRAAAYRAYYKNPHARGIIDNLVNFTLDYGAKIVISPEEHTKALIDAVTEEWEAFAKLNKFRRYQKEFARRLFREGEQFTRILEPEKPTGSGLRAKPGKPARIYFLEPDWILSKKPEITYGIETVNGDVGNIKSYRVVIDPAKDEIILTPESVLHTKIGVDMNVKRGRTLLEPVLPDLAKLMSFRDIRVILNNVRSSVVMVMKRGVQAAQQQADIAKERSTRPGARSNALTLPPAGTRINTDKDTEVEFKNPNLGASEAGIDNRLIVLAIASGVLMPEFVLSMDASNNNFASIREACMPLIKFVNDMQATLEEEWQDLFERIIGLSVKAGRLPAEALDVKCEFEFEPFDIKNYLQEAQATQILLSNNLISRTTASARFGYSYEEELEKIAAEQEALNDLGMNPFDDKGDGKGDGKGGQGQGDNNNDDGDNNDDTEE